MRSARFAVLLSLLLLAGCGYVGPVLPPSPEIPTPVKDLSAIERGDKIEIAFHTPARTADGIAIKKFSEIDLRIGPELVPFDFESWAETAKAYPLPLPPPGDPLDPKPLPLSASIPLEGLMGKRVVVAVRTDVKRGDNYSAWSNRIVLEVIPPLKPPSAVHPGASADGVVLDWHGSDDAKSYRILRQTGADNTALEIGTSEQTHFVDISAQFDVPYSYQVVAVSGSAESNPSEAAAITALDTFPPSVPGGVTALAGPESLELSWQRSPEADLAGYFVYRSTNGSAFERLGSMQSLPAYSDQKVEHANMYRYQITSVDKKNNESAKSATVEVAF